MIEITHVDLQKHFFKMRLQTSNWVDFAMSENAGFQGGAVAFSGWKDLEQLRKFASENGCTQAQFAYAVESAGDQPAAVAAYLDRHAFTSKPSVRTSDDSPRQSA